MRLILILFIFTHSFFAQNDESENKGRYFQKSMEYIESRNIVLQQKSIHNFSTIHSIGYKINRSYCINIHYYTYGSISVHKILPEKIVINDTLTTNRSGSNINLMLGLDILNTNPNYDIFILYGFEFGRLRLYGNPLLRKKNGYFAPKIEIQPTFKIKRFVIGGSFGYGYDISNPNWKNTWFSKNKSYTLDKLNQSGFSYQAFIGWSFN